VRHKPASHDYVALSELRMIVDVSRGDVLRSARTCPCLPYSAPSAQGVRIENCTLVVESPGLAKSIVNKKNLKPGTWNKTPYA
jgi:hypothetical protein